MSNLCLLCELSDFPQIVTVVIAVCGIFGILVIVAHLHPMYPYNGIVQRRLGLDDSYAYVESVRFVPNVCVERFARKVPVFLAILYFVPFYDGSYPKRHFVPCLPFVRFERHAGLILYIRLDGKTAN